MGTSQVFQTALPGLKQADNSIPVAVVVVAMTKAEAAELASEQAFNRQLDVLREDFRRLSLYLKSKGWDLWPQHYGAKAEHWKPRGQQRIEDLTRDIMKRVNDEKRGEWKPLRPRFYDIRLLDSATPDGRRLLRRLRAQGCMVIIDSISMRHPALLRAYQISLLDVFPNTSVISLAQNEETFDLMRDMVHALQMTFKESELHFRQRDPMERQACQAYTDWEKAEPWFVNRLMTVYGERAKESGVRSQIKYDS